MRPVNLIPPEDRRGEKAPLRTGLVAYIVVAVLAVALVGVTLVVMIGNQIADRKAEKASLEDQVAQVQAEAQKLNTFVDFAALQEARQQTVASLATSRFDWERVLRELAIVIPQDVWLTNLAASSAPDASSSGSSTASSSSATADILGPSLDIQGCAGGHDAVARFLASLRDVDGVTRVVVMNSDRQGASGSGASGTSSTSGGTSGGSCSSRSFVASFEVVAAFDSAQPTSLPSTASGTTTTETTPAPSDSATTTASVDQSQVSDGEQQLQQQKDSAAQKTAEGRKAVGTFIPGTGSTP
jgi:Tfp pilus assembly protein PilN